MIWLAKKYALAGVILILQELMSMYPVLKNCKELIALIQLIKHCNDLSDAKWWIKQLLVILGKFAAQAVGGYYIIWAIEKITQIMNYL